MREEKQSMELARLCCINRGIGLKNVAASEPFTWDISLSVDLFAVNRQERGKREY